MSDNLELRQRLGELREHDTAAVPSFAKVLRGPERAPRQVWPRLAWLGATTAAAMVAIAWWPREPQAPEPVGSPTATVEPAPADWTAPTDALLADVATAADLSREINQLLNQP